MKNILLTYKDLFCEVVQTKCKRGNRKFSHGFLKAKQTTMKKITYYILGQISLLEK